MLVIAASLILALHATSQAASPIPRSPIEIPCDLETGYCFVTIQIDSKPYNFLVDTGNTDSYISRTALRAIARSDKHASFTIGPVTVPVASLSILTKAEDKLALKPDGYLGMDVLSKLIFGIDYEKGQFLVWPAGANRDVAMQWVTSRGLGAISEGVAGPQGDNRLFIPSGYGGDLCIDTGMNTMLLPENPAKEKDFVDSGIVTPMRIFDRGIGKVKIEVIPHPAGLPAMLDNLPVFVTSHPMPYGVCGAVLLGPRLLVDGLNKTICKTVGQDDSFEFWTAMAFIYPFVNVIDGKLYIPVNHDTAPHVADKDLPKEGRMEIVSINGISIADLFATYSKHDGAGSQTLKKIIVAVRKGCKADILVDGRHSTVDLELLGDIPG